MTSHDTAAPAADLAPRSADPARPRIPTSITVAFATVLVALVARQVFALWEHYDGSTTYDELVGFGGALMPMNLLVFGPSFAVGFAAQAVLAVRLARGRGRVLTGIGASALGLGGILFALVTTAHALPFDWAANHGILDEPAGREAVTAFDTIGTPVLVPYILATQAVIALGAVVTAVGARLSGTIPIWLLVVVLVLIAALALAPGAGTPLDAVLSFAQAAVWAVLAWFGWRGARR